MGLCNDSLGVSEDPHFRSWWLGILAGASELARSSDQGLGCVLGTSYRASMAGACLLREAVPSGTFMEFGG